MSEVSQQTQKLIQRYVFWSDSLQPKEGTPVIHVDEVASRVAAFYEKIRGVIDWREEHLLRRAAIERVLKRKFFLRIGEKIDAQPVVLELIRGGHFPNNKIPETKIAEVQAALDKYIYIIENKPSDREKSKVQIQDWLSTIAACEVEEILDPQRRERALLDYMTELMQERTKLPNDMAEEEKNTQVYIAVQRALFKLDAPVIVYHLLKRAYPGWMNIQIAELEEITKNISAIWKNIIKEISYPLSEKFYRICEQMDTPYLILGDILSEDPKTALEKMKDPEAVEIAVRKSYQIRLNQLKSRLMRAALLSTISIFLTKILIAIAIEYPFDQYVTHQFTYRALGLSILIPSALMLFLVLTIRPPRKSNLEKVVLETMKIVYESEKKDIYTIRISKGGGIVKGFVFLFYLATFVFSFWLIWWGLEKLGFSWLSKLIFLLFLSLISFAGTKIRERAKELSAEEESGGFFGFFFDWFFLPFIQVGKWLSSQWVKYNILLVIIIALIDLPFHVFVEFLEQWRYFLKEKKEDIH